MPKPRSYGETPGEAAINWIERVGACDLIEDLEDAAEYNAEEILKISHELEMIFKLGVKSYREGNRLLDHKVVNINEVLKNNTLGDIAL